MNSNAGRLLKIVNLGIEEKFHNLVLSLYTSIFKENPNAYNNVLLRKQCNLPAKNMILFRNLATVCNCKLYY